MTEASIATTQEEFVLDSANENDVSFIAQALMFSERAHTGTGIWDIVCGQENTLKVMELACHDERAHFHFSKFKVIREVSTGKAVAGACSFVYPDFSVSKSIPAVSKAVQEVISQSDAEIEAAWKSLLDFLLQSFPPYDDWDSFMFEAVYTLPAYRGKGLAFRIISSMLEEAKQGKGPGGQQTKSVIACAAGNTSALRLYAKLGYEDAGHGVSEACMQALGTPGFHLLHQKLGTALASSASASVAK